MKDLGMSWPDIKATPRIELEGLMAAYSEYSEVHSFDGYSAEDVSEMTKNKPQVRSQYMEYMEARARLEEKIGSQTQSYLNLNFHYPFLSLLLNHMFE
jgi:hypothetical protein